MRVREIAEKIGLLVADKPDSQDICFVPDGDYAAYIEENTGKKASGRKFCNIRWKCLREA